MSDHSKTLKSIKSGGFARGLSLLKASIKAGTTAAKHFVFSDMTTEEKTAYLISQVKSFTHEMGQLKGSAMKVGQLLSTYGEHFLPPEANKILKSLQQKSPPVDWPVIHQQLRSELGEKLLDLEIEQTPLASASIGQVHLATHKISGEKFAVKVQYPGVDQAIETDLKLFKFLLGTLQLLPKGARMDMVFGEVKDMFKQEVDYKKEFEFTEKFYQKLFDDQRYCVPEPQKEYSTSKIITTRYIEGNFVDSPEVLSLSQERRNKLGLHFLELYLKELTEYKLVQTDPHFGNYRVQIDPNGENDRLVLFDFGAMRKVPLPFLKDYKRLIKGGLQRDEKQTADAGESLGLLLPNDSVELREKYIELCFLITEPFADPEWQTVPDDLMDANGNYNWGKSDLPKRVAKKGSEIALNFKLRSPPKETIFLDRKLGGVFIFLKVLGCKLRSKELLEGFL